MDDRAGHYGNTNIRTVGGKRCRENQKHCVKQQEAGTLNYTPIRLTGSESDLKTNLHKADL